MAAATFPSEPVEFFGREVRLGAAEVMLIDNLSKSFPRLSSVDGRGADLIFDGMADPFLEI
ncbi:MAG: hypothetical protein JO159_05300 [Acidobacteria bacterium]|nr:hypothetical protein [Acidobacteriota bacterium]